MRIARIIPPSAAPVSAKNLLYGFLGMLAPDASGKFENELREYFRTRHVFTVSSGKAGLTLILEALNRMSGRKKVLIPAYTCYSVPSAIRKAGLRTVLCDVNPDTLDYDFAQLEGLVDEDVLCIISTHLFGIPSDVVRIRDITRHTGAYVVEDAAQAMGVMSNGKKLGSIGDAGFFSLGRGKNITCGSGGIILTSSDEIAKEIGRSYRTLKREPVVQVARNILEVLSIKLFLSPYLYWIPKGMPFLRIGETRFHESFPVFRLSPFKAGTLHDWIPRLTAYNQAREEASRYYVEALGLENRSPLYSNCFPCLRFPILCKDEAERKTLYERAENLGASLMYPGTVDTIREIRDQFGEEQYKNANNIANTLLTLPTHIYVRKRDRETIHEILKEWTNRGRPNQ